MFKLRFEDVAVTKTTKIATTPEAVSVPTADYFTIEPLKDLVSMDEDSERIKIKSKRKKIFADKIVKLSHKVIRKLIGNVNAHTVVSLMIF